MARGLAARRDELRRSDNWSLGANHDASVCDLFFGLGDVASVGKERGACRADEQSGGAAGESGEVANVGEVRDEEEVELAGSEFRLEAAQARVGSHAGSLAGGWKKLWVCTR